MNYENKEMCTKCGGKCCLNHPGLFGPGDFINSSTGKFDIERISNRLRSGLYCLYHYGKGNHGPIIVPGPMKISHSIEHIKTKDLGIATKYTSGRCVFLKEDGCVLDAESRPYECRFLKPSDIEDEECEYVGIDIDSKEFVDSWRPYQEDLIRALRDSLVVTHEAVITIKSYFDIDLFSIK